MPKPIRLATLGMLLSEQQIPQVVMNIKSRQYRMERLEAMSIPWAQEVAASNLNVPDHFLLIQWWATKRETG